MDAEIQLNRDKSGVLGTSQVGPTRQRSARDKIDRITHCNEHHVTTPPVCFGPTYIVPRMNVRHGLIGV